MVFEFVEDRARDKSDPRNRGILCDWKVNTREGHLMRVITYHDPQSGHVYDFLSNEFDLPAGVVVELYRRRWEVEKVFDEIKNKLGQKKAWGTTLVAKHAQALLIAVTHNLLLLYESKLERRHGVVNGAENKRRANRANSAATMCSRLGMPISSLVLQARRATQRSLKFIRWLRQSILEGSVLRGVGS